MLSKFPLIFITLNLVILNVTSLKCYTCNSYMSVGCNNPLNSGSYFLQQCSYQNNYCVQKVTADQNGNTISMERGCSNDCSSQTNSLYSNNVNNAPKTYTNICCQTDNCNYSTQLISNNANLFVVLVTFCLVLYFY